jgi:thiol-disulfide isomerase/thioredoxin
LHGVNFCNFEQLTKECPSMMKKFILITLLTGFGLTLISQPLAPDFTVTDSDGVQHQLYQDYLNQGKTVVIDLFFTYCPPCIELAPFLETLYESWGSGSGDVEFIGLSVQNDDYNTHVAQFKITHGVSYPAVGVDGGAIPAVQPFYSGDWGAFEGVPTFVVISPDGTVNFDPSNGVYEGNGVVELLEEAIRQSGARKPYNLTGTVTTPGGIGIGSFDLEIDGQLYSPENIGADELFETEILLRPDSVYAITAVKSGSYNDGLTTFDMIKIRKHLLGVETFNESWKYLASDANHSGAISTADLIQLTKLVLAVSNNLPDNAPWGFLRTDYLFISPGNPYAEAYEGDARTYQYMAGSGLPLDFIGYKIGDINESADSN